MTEQLGVDYAWAHPAPAAVKADGYGFVLRYLSTDPAKNLTPAEVKGLHDAGLSVGVVWETAAQRALDGEAAGQADAHAAEAQADALGYPAGCPIFYAVDFGATGAQMPTVEAYFAGIRAMARRPVGVYGSAAVVEAVLAVGAAEFAWQTCAWSGTGVSTRAHLYQRLHPTRAAISGTDEDVLLQPVPLWDPAALVVDPVVFVPPKPPTPAPARPPAPAHPIQNGGLVVDVIDLTHADTHPVTGPGVKPMQRLLGVVADGSAGPVTKRALGAAQRRMFGPAGVDFKFGVNTVSDLLAGK